MASPPAITVRVPTPLRTTCGGASELSVAAANVRAALDDLAGRHPSLHKSICDETGAVRDRAGLDTTFEPGDVLTIMPAVSGGLRCPTV